MNIIEMYAKVKEIFEANENEFEYIGIRFEDKEREIGDVCENSRHNPDRDDERDFPVFGSAEYEELPVLDGTSAWNLASLSDRNYPGFGRPSKADPEKECSRYFFTEHCYIIASNRQGSHDDPDEDEILIRDAIVIAKIF